MIMSLLFRNFIVVFAIVIACQKSDSLSSKRIELDPPGGITLTPFYCKMYCVRQVRPVAQVKNDTFASQQVPRAVFSADYPLSADHPLFFGKSPAAPLPQKDRS